MTTLLKKKQDGGLIPSLKTEVNELFDFDRFFDRPFLPSAFRESWRKAVLPPANIREAGKEFVLELAAPGMEKSDFVVDVDNGKLEIKVEKEDESKEENDRYTRREYSYNAFYRSFELPETVNADKITAEYQNGILQVHMPKVATATKKKVKEISVK